MRDYYRKQRLRTRIQSKFKAGIPIEHLKAQYLPADVDKYIGDQLCSDCENALFTQYNHADDQVCDTCHTEGINAREYPQRYSFETESEYFNRLGAYAAGLDDSEVFDLEQSLGFGYGE